LLCIIIAATANAQSISWPERPIRFVVPYTPGGGTDVVSRNLTHKIARNTEWTLVVENKPGAGGNIGLDIVAKARPDGYTLGMGQTSNLAINPAVLPAMPFNVDKDIIPVAMIAEVPMILVVRAESPYKTLDKLITAAKNKDAGIKQGVAGLGTVGHLAGEMLALQAGYKVLIVPYKGASPALADLMGGQTDFMFATPQGLMPLIEAGKLRALAVTSAKRLSLLSDIPTLSESGFENFVATDWKVVIAPVNTDEAILNKLNEVINNALHNPELIKQLESEGSTPMGGSVQEAKRYVKDQQNQWAQLIQRAHLSF